MSIEDPDVIDIIGIDRTTGDVVLTISDHLDWSDSVAHQLLLQAKLNRSLAFVEGGEIFEEIPCVVLRAVDGDRQFEAKRTADDSGRMMLCCRF